MKSSARVHADQVIHGWRMLEMFSPQALPSKERTGSYQVIEWEGSSPLPWESLPAATGKKVWRHQVFAGTYRIQDAYGTLHSLFPANGEAFDTRAPGLSACALFAVDERGGLLAEASALSQCAWGVGQILLHHRRAVAHLDDFDAAEQAFRQEVLDWWGERLSATDPATGSPLLGSDLEHMVGVALRATGVDKECSLAGGSIWIRSAQVAPESAPDVSFLNSFFVNDLARVKAVLADGIVGEALISYLRPDDVHERERIDVRRNPDVVDAAVTPDRAPAGRWPSVQGHTLSVSQQFAVNEILSGSCTGGSLFAVNGPPGTGKTTMLRDLIAANVVRRAVILAGYATPDQAFGVSKHEWLEKGRRRSVCELDPKLVGYEMVVGSSNNGAVENLSLEIPGQDVVDPDRVGALDYFKDVATSLLSQARAEASGGRASAGTSAEETPAWALVAARLGRKAFRGQAVERIWWNAACASVREQLKAGSPNTKWADSVADFRRAQTRVENLVALRLEAARRLAKVPRLEAKLAKKRDEFALVIKACAHAQQEVEAASAQCTMAQNELAEARENIDLHAKLRPRWFELLLGRTRAWRTEADRLSCEVREATSRFAGAKNNLAHQESQAREIWDLSTSLRGEKKSLDIELEALRRALDIDVAQFGKAHPLSIPVADRELRLPWSDAELNDARSDLFVAALQLHKDWLLSSSQVLPQMDAAMSVVQGVAPRDLQSEAQLAAWRLFFMLVPVVSTTFASYAGMFGGLGAEALGWLFIDEAGQCTPQAALGAIWRSRNVVAVGDPLQLEPVVAIPEKIVGDIGAAAGSSPQWWPPQASVQRLADRSSTFGTTLGTPPDEIWVGAPLRAHRRCDEPMFTISNTVAYDGLMINAVHRSPDAYPPVWLGNEALPSSAWFDVPADHPGCVTQPRQIDCARALIAMLLDRGVTSKDIFVISPFRSVAHELRQLCEEHPGMAGGTIHTAQGREAAAVILVLGTEHARDGSRAWAATTPNLVNVAVSRAKRRLYVVGDYADWSGHRYFDVLARELPRHAWSPGVAWPDSPVFPRGSDPDLDPDAEDEGPSSAKSREVPTSSSAEPVALPPRRGLPWKDSEREELVGHVMVGYGAEEIAALHGRSVGAIRSEVLRLLPAELRYDRGLAIEILRSLLPEHDWREQRQRTRSEGGG